MQYNQKQVEAVFNITALNIDSADDDVTIKLNGIYRTRKGMRFIYTIFYLDVLNQKLYGASTFSAEY